MIKTNIPQKEYIPDSSQAEEWLTEDIFTWRGMKFKILPNCQIVKVKENNKRPEGEVLSEL